MAQDARDCPGGSKVGFLPTGGRGMTRAVLAVVAGVVAGGLWVPAPLAAQTASLPVAADTYLRSGSANQSQGSDSFLRLQSSGNNRALLSVSTSDLVQTVGSGRLVSASLEVYVQSNGNNWGPDGRTVDVHRVLADWSEAGATWNCGVDTNPGNSQPDCDPQWAGGIFADEPSDTVLHSSGQTGWVEFEVTEDAQAFLAGEPNFGWLLKKTEENQSGKVDYTSREGAAAQRPKLVLLVENAENDVVPPTLSIVEPHEAILVNETSPTDRRRVCRRRLGSRPRDVGGGGRRRTARRLRGGRERRDLHRRRPWPPVRTRSTRRFAMLAATWRRPISALNSCLGPA